MNGVRGVSNAGGAGRLQGRTVQQGGRFSVANAGSMAEPVIVASAAIGALIAIQDEAAPARRDHAARRGGEALLQDLSKLQASLLGGHAPGALMALQATLARLPQAADPQLNGILASIRLRASIELTRRGGLMTNP